MWLYRVSQIVWPLCSLYWRARITGEVQAIPARGPLLVAANHASFMDPWFLSAVFPRRLSYLITDKWYYKSRVWTGFFRANGTLPVRGGDAPGTIDDICAALASGRLIGIFPEGRISPDGKLRHFRSGIARAAARSGAPVVPVGIRGSFEILPRDRRVPLPGKITVYVGRPALYPGAPHRTDPPEDELRAFRLRIFAEVCRLCGQDAGATEAGDAATPAEPG